MQSPSPGAGPNRKPSPVHSSLLRTSEAIDLVMIAACVGLGVLNPLPWTSWLTASTAAWLAPTLRFGLGGVLTSVAVLLILGSKRAMSRQGQATEPGKLTTALVTDGVFAYSRNPIYLASLLLYLAAALVFDTVWPALLLPFAALAFQLWLIAPEERALRELFGAEYAAYQARVRRWC